jgi:hypothetical protein
MSDELAKQLRDEAGAPDEHVSVESTLLTAAADRLDALEAVVEATRSSHTWLKGRGYPVSTYVSEKIAELDALIEAARG